ncbi:glutaminyl-peptide cyclotransferase [Massilia psychrophila]|uniref:glutaminyl-peptide cyclotransferase n=1 Tax=Massilia psychrophila TaxID=1603353 RepID=UPI0019BEE318|nr:glutaminyl-peptide cyclotransferase [Massilia psychrophila]GGE63816.1 glutamine cyclotransferase [Massilia psychrophila]
MKKSTLSVRRRLLLGALAWSVGGFGAAEAAIPVYAFMVKHAYPHDTGAFTQGLFIKDGVLYESTGLKGQSSIRRVQLETGRVLQKKEVPAEFFGEGIAAVGDDIVGLTWTSKVGFVYDAKTFDVKRKFSYEGEGWGLTSNGKQVFMSDGSPAIRVLDPKTLAEVRRIRVSADGKPIAGLNELEWVDGQIYANVWGSNVIARIDPANGNVLGWIDLTGLADPAWKGMGPDDVLNGIAWDAVHRRLFVTGKHWPKLFEIELVERTGRR